ncbi:uncharacterized protein [Littorina saxatilis]|uniref:uncharacterized protein n=1 Tax=Littorina saxatilis TaxID=31220 RepID=UPI0038B5F73B
MAESKASVAVTIQKNGIAVVRMQRGDNRINNEFVRAFNDCLDQVEKASSCKGVVTTGEGKFYSNGLDTDWLATIDSDTMANFLRSLVELLLRLLTFPLPTVAAINGHCYAGGALIAFATDLRVMNSQRGWLCFNEVFINRRFGQFNIKYLQAKINPARTLHRAIVFGQRFTGPEAEAAGMVDNAVAPPIVLQESQRLLQAWIGKEGFPRESLHNMKLDLYADAIKEVHAPSKL